MTKAGYLLLTCAAAALVPGLATAQTLPGAKAVYNIAAQDLGRALTQLAQASNREIYFAADLTRGKRAPELHGSYTFAEALNRLLANSGLTYRIGDNGAIVIESLSAQQTSDSGISDILVIGSRSQNTDIVRTRDDPQPYVVVTADDIRKSNATTLDQVLRTRLPQNAQRVSHNQRDGSSFDVANAGQIDLRGLGTNQTLVLVDGRRLPGVSEGGDLKQSSIAGIPLTAIERIEVLPSTAGAIYGGSAVGGVVNIVLKRDYSGVDLNATYGNTFDRKTGDLSASLNGGFNLGPASIMATAAYVRTGQLLGSDRDGLVRRAQALADANNPQQGNVPRLGGAPNFCSTGFGYSCDGPSLVFKNGTAYNAKFGSVPAGYAGPAGDGGAGLLSGAGRYSLGTPPGPNALIQRSEMESLGLNVRLPIVQGIESYADVNWDRTHANNRNNAVIFGVLRSTDVNNPFRQDILVNYSTPRLYGTGTNTITNLRANGGLIIRLPHKWSMSLEQNWARTRSASTSNNDAISRDKDKTPLLQLGTRDTNAFPPAVSPNTQPGFINGPAISYLVDSTVRLSGPTFSLGAADPIVLTALAERRQNRFSETINQYKTGSKNDSVTIIPRQRQTIHSLYAEARVPIFSARNARLMLDRLEFQASIRHDRYVTLGTSDQFSGATLEKAKEASAKATYSTNRVDSTDYLAAIIYAPVEDITFRASYSTGFLPPSNSQVNTTLSSLPGAFLGFFGYFDPRRGKGGFPGDAKGNITFRNGGNPNLQPELSKSTSFGVILKPRFIEGLRISADYTRIAKSNEIYQLDAQQILLNEAALPGRVVRRDPLPGDPSGFAGPVVSIDRTYLNIFRSNISSLDFQLDYDVATKSFGNFHLYMIGTHALKLERQIDPQLALVDTVDFADGPLKWRGNIGLDWTMDDLRLNWNMQYYSGYKGYASDPDPAFRDIFVLNQGTARIPAQSYHDIAASYRFSGSHWLSGTELGLGIQNLFNTLPPAINSNNGLYSTYGDPRLRRFTLRLTRHL